MNSTVGPSFKKNFVEKSTCGSREQCTGSTDRDANALKIVFSAIQTNAWLKTLWNRINSKMALKLYIFISLVNENFVEKSTCGSHEQCTGLIDRDANALKNVSSPITNAWLKTLWSRINSKMALKLYIFIYFV